MAEGQKLSISGLSAGYGAIEILHGINLEIQRGQFVALMGPNGAGKSTLLKSIFGMATIRSGRIEWKGRNVAGERPRSILTCGIAYVPQGRCNFPLMTVEENLEMAVYSMETKKNREDREYIFELFPILKLRRRTLAGNMSGGEQQVLETAMAMLRRPEILLIDEPSAGLSPQASATVFQELKRLHNVGLTILLVEQNTAKALEVAQRSVVLRLGRIIWDCGSGEITRSQLGELFMTGSIDKGSSSPASGNES